VKDDPREERQRKGVVKNEKRKEKRKKPRPRRRRKGGLEGWWEKERETDSEPFEPIQ
jgi:hypothetical protein